MELSKSLNDEIIKFINDNQPEFYYDYQDKLEKESIIKILDEGLEEFEQKIIDNSLDYIFNLEDGLLEEVFNSFEDEIIKEFKKEYNNPEDGNVIQDFLSKNYKEYIFVDTKINDLLDVNILCNINVYSNYDCCNSFDDPDEPETYLSEVYKRVNKGVKKEDFKFEFYNGAYGGSLFCFVFESSLKELLKLKEELKSKKQIIIPKGTQFGFFSSFQGAGSVFEKTTYKTLKLNIKEEGKGYYPEYDYINIDADCQQSYSFDDIYGGFEADCQDIEVA